jgi:hypothetical protein
MAEKELTVPEELPVDKWKSKVIVIGGLVGALVGVGSAYLLTQNMEKSGKRPHLSTQSGLRLLVLLIATVRNIANLWQD